MHICNSLSLSLSYLSLSLSYLSLSILSLSLSPIHIYMAMWYHIVHKQSDTLSNIQVD